MAVKTIFGWTLFGGRSSDKSISANFLSFERLEASVERFWDQESYGTTSKLSPALLTKDERRALSLLEEGTSLVGGRCQVGMLWKEDQVHLVNNRFLAEKRLLSTEKRLEKFPEIKGIYHSKIEEYITLGHVKKLSDVEAKSLSSKPTTYRIILFWSPTSQEKFESSLMLLQNSMAHHLMTTYFQDQIC